MQTERRNHLKNKLEVIASLAKHDSRYRKWLRLKSWGGGNVK